MGRLTEEERQVRERLRGHLWRLMDEHKIPVQSDFAKKVGIDPGHLSACLSGAADPGFDVALRLHAVLGESLNHLCDDPPGEKYVRKAEAAAAHGLERRDHKRRKRAGAAPPPPVPASQGTAHPGRRKHGAGNH